MKRMFQIIGGMLLIFTLIYLLVMVYMPDNYTVQRSIFINSESYNIVPQLNNFHNWNNNWSPWFKKDSMINITYSGPESGKEASMRWESLENGKGKLTIIYSGIDSVTYLSHFSDFDTYSNSIFLLSSESDGTRLTWITKGKLSFFFRWFEPFMDKMMGKDYEIGLKNIKEFVENSSNGAPLPLFEIEETTINIKNSLVVKVKCDKSNIAKTLAESYSKILKEMNIQGLQIEGHPFAIYHPIQNTYFELEVGIPINKIAKNVGEVQYRNFLIQSVIQTVFSGSYDSTFIAHNVLKKWLVQHKKRIPSESWEFYLNHSSDFEQAKEFKTLVVYPRVD